MAVGDAMGLGIVLEAKDLFSGTMRSAGMAFKDVEGATSEAGKKITDNLKTLGTGMAIFSAGLGGLALLVPASAAAFSKFEHELAQIRTVIDETAFSTQAADAAAQGLADTYGSGPIAQAHALYETISAGVTDATKAVDLLSIANELAIGGDAELAQGVDILTSSVNAYAATGLTAADASDALFVAIAAGKTNAAELSASLGEVIPTAQALGVGFDELAASVAALTLQGIKTPQAITGLNAVLANIAKPTSDATKEAMRLGIQFDATALKTKGLTGVLAQLSGNTKVNDSTFVQLFGSIDGVKSALALTAGGGAKLNDILAQMEGKAGATHKAFEIMAATSGFQEKRFASLKESALVLIGEAMEPAAAAALKFGNAVLSAFNNLPDSVRTFLVQGFALASTLLVIVGGAIALKGAIGVLGAGLSAAGVTLGSFLAILAPVAVALAVVGLAVAAFRVAWEQDLGGLATMVRSAFASVKLALGAFAQLFDDGGISGSIREDLNKAENAGLKQFVKNVYLFANRLQTAWDGISEGFGHAMQAAKPAFEAFTNSLVKLGEAFGFLSEGQTAEDALGTFNSFTTAGEKIGTVLGKVAVAVVNIMTVAIDLVGGLVKGLTGISTAAKPAVDALMPIGESIAGINNELDRMSGKVSSTEGGWASLGKLIGGIVGGITSIIAASMSGLFAWFNGVVNIIGGIIEIFHGNFSKGIQRILYGAVSGIVGIVGGVIQTLATMADKVMGIFGKDSGMGAKVADLRKSFDTTAAEGFGVKDHAFAAGSEEERLNREQLVRDAQASLVPEAKAFTPAGAEQLASGVDTAALASVIAASAAKQPPQKAPIVNVTMTLDGRELAGALANVSRADADASGAPGMAVMD